MGQFAFNFAVAHREYLAGLASGYAIAHIPEAVLFLFHIAMRVPWLRAAVVANPTQAKAVVDAIAKELDKDIDSEAAGDTKPPAP